eukprot:284815440_2
MTSNFSATAPSSRRRCRPSSSRAVATTRSPAARAWRTHSKPMPREAPTINTVAMFKSSKGNGIGDSAPGSRLQASG